MPELLIYNKNKYTPSGRGFSYGDIISVCKNGHQWGQLECLNTFYIVKVDIPLSVAMMYEEPLYNPVDTITIKLKRRYKFDIVSGLSSVLRTQMFNSPTLLIPTVSVANIIDKSTWQ